MDLLAAENLAEGEMVEAASTVEVHHLMVPYFLEEEHPSEETEVVAWMEDHLELEIHRLAEAVQEGVEHLRVVEVVPVEQLMVALEAEEHLQTMYEVCRPVKVDFVRQVIVQQQNHAFLLLLLF